MSDRFDQKREYTNGELTVVWEPEKCMHSGVCMRGLFSVFQPGERPWVKMDASDSGTIENQVAQCPSGALSCKRN
ncbi:MAG: (4Fe-4S)-binding protein [Bacteroidetes bacterium]|nr:MAG: (4Fe-4S)-binding protein [Bacteroidota bacterium]